jgi:lysine-specific demethylase/histidyl-hydroxylase NO66
MGACNSESENDGRKSFMKTVERLMSKLFQFAPVDAAADQMGRKFIRDSLPPYLTER